MNKKHIISVSLLSILSAHAVGADTTDNLKVQIDELRDRVEKVERAEAGNLTPGVIQIPGTNTTIKFGGYVQADLTHDVRVKNGPYFNAGATTPDSAVDKPETTLRANQSRFNARTSTAMPSGKPMVGFFEIDFMAADPGANEVFSNSEGVRLREAYLSYDGFLAGQTWSNFQDFAAYPVLLDISSPAGRVFVRQPQLRYTTGAWAVSLENPETQPIYLASNQAESLGGIGEDTVPDLVVSWRHNGASSYQVSGVVRQMGVKGTLNVDPNDPTAGTVSFDETKTGWGVNVAGRWKFGGTTLKANAAMGEGIGRYINNGWGNGMRLYDDGSVSLIESYGVSGALEQSWSAQWASTFSYGLFKNKDDIGAFGTDEISTYRANLRYQALANTMIGAEVMYATRDFVGGADGDNTRIQFSARHSF